MQLVSMAPSTIVQTFWCNERGRHFLRLAWTGCSLLIHHPREVDLGELRLHYRVAGDGCKRAYPLQRLLHHRSINAHTGYVDGVKVQTLQ